MAPVRRVHRDILLHCSILHTCDERTRAKYMYKLGVVYHVFGVFFFSVLDPFGSCTKLAVDFFRVVDLINAGNLASDA